VGGLQVIVVALQESERAANQLKGRAGRQGDPGETFTLVTINDPVVAAAGFSQSLASVQDILERK
jgi:preprotein translocase subunit SecA